MSNTSTDKERSTSIEAEHKDAEHYDKWLLTISSGALGLSIAFVRDIAPEPIVDTKYWLVIAWSAFLSSIISTMLSLLVSQKAFQSYREHIDSEASVYKNYWGTGTTILNWLSLVLFTVGAISLARYSYLNL